MPFKNLARPDVRKDTLPSYCRCWWAVCLTTHLFKGCPTGGVGASAGFLSLRLTLSSSFTTATCPMMEASMRPEISSLSFAFTSAPCEIRTYNTHTHTQTRKGSHTARLTLD